MTVELRVHTNAIVDALKDDFNVGDGIAKTRDGSGNDLPIPYVVVYRLGSELRGPRLDMPHEDAELLFQLSCVGTSRQQAEWLRDLAVAVLDEGVEVEGRALMPMVLESAPVLREDVGGTTLYTCAQRVRFWSTPGEEGS